ncbi:MAG: allantoate amidohydrolase [Hyphomicrobiales bacterium]|nr:allantoate amidohydrolase [Hyphomicrobiales bacterium]
MSDRYRLADRIVERIEELGEISETPGMLTRVCFSPEHRRAADLILGWMRDAGMAARMDEIGNAVGRYEGAQPGLPCLMLGSHYDTVRDAGKWDGPLGVITAIECVADLARRGLRLPLAIEVVGFADEEGVRFSSTLLGSSAIAGTFDKRLLDAKGRDGLTMREAVLAFGLEPDAIGRAARKRCGIHAYIELHIEQGPVLEEKDLPVGVVTAISGASRFRIELDGRAGHAGTVPMTLRRDALAGAADCIAAVERRCCGVAGLVGTVGQITAEPGATNVIPGRVSFSVDLRASEDQIRENTIARVLEDLREIAARRNLRLAIAKTHECGTVQCAVWLREQIAAAIKAGGHSVTELPSGAGHDGMAMADIADIGMIFVRCRDGVSHHPDEHTETADVEAAALTLLHFIENFKPHTEPRI